MRAIWESQGAGERLVTRLHDAPQEFNRAMQDGSSGSIGIFG
jgi:hypothetical protein